MRQAGVLLVLGVMLAAGGVQAQTAGRCMKNGQAAGDAATCRVTTSKELRPSARQAASTRPARKAVDAAPAKAARPADAKGAADAKGTARAAGRPARAAGLVSGGVASAAAASPRAVAESMPKAAPVAKAAPRLPWSGLTRGMSPQTVRSRMPATRPLEGGRLINGAQALLVREGIGFAGFEYRADYYFQDGEYLQVSLKKPDGMPRENDEVRREFEHLARVLLQEFGEPSGRRPLVQNHFSLSGGIEWELPGNDKAWLAILPVNRRTSHLTFGYRPDNDWHLR